MRSGLQIHRLDVEVLAHIPGESEATKFEANFDFSDGINIVHARNTMGKSTCINSIIYALGLEMMLGKKGIQSLTNSLWGKIEFNGIDYEVDKSSVSLEVSNSKGERIRIKRSVTNPDEDTRLVHVYRGQQEEEKYYLHDPGAVQNAKGFHNFLSDFLGWNLPLVTTFEGNRVPLYPECIFPLFFIEQKKGWSKLQATIPTIYKIKNPGTQAIEFILKLDVSALNTERETLKIELDRLMSDWHALCGWAKDTASKIGGLLEGMPDRPPLKNEQIHPSLKLHLNNKLLTIEEWQRVTQMEIDELQETVESKTYNSAEAESTLSILEDKLNKQEDALGKAKLEYELEIQNFALIENRIRTIDEDIKKNQETLKIQRYANEIETQVTLEVCPSCGQGMENTLMPPGVDEIPMSIEDNINYLKEQKSSAQALLAQTRNTTLLKATQSHANELELNALRQKVRDMKQELRQDVRIPKISQIRDLALKENRFNEVNVAVDEFNKLPELISKIAEAYEGRNLRFKELANTRLSPQDQSKLDMLQGSLRANLELFEFKTVHPAEIEISPFTYEPVADGIQLYTNASASDSIRLIAAYTLALIEVSNKMDGNHVNLMIIDELKQQDIDTSSINGIYKKMQSFGSDAQFIVTSSAADDHLGDMTKGILFKLINFQNKVIAPKDGNKT